MSRILLVDDNRDAVRATAALLEHWGHEVRVVGDGSFVLHLARAWRPHLVLLDIGLPGMDGLQVAALLRREPALQSSRIIAISALYRDGDEASLAAAGVDQLLRKPLDPAFLRSLLGDRAPPGPPANYVSP
jgi:CheY-like chemotaxis protein